MTQKRSRLHPVESESKPDDPHDHGSAHAGPFHFYWIVIKNHARTMMMIANTVMSTPQDLEIMAQ